MSEPRKDRPSCNPIIPDKLYFRIGEVARLLDVETHTLRFWETEFPQLRVGKGGTGQRLYRRRDVELVCEIKNLLYRDGYTIPGARQLLQTRQRDKGTSTVAKPVNNAVPLQNTSQQPKLERIRAELRDLSDLLSAQEPVTSSSPPGTPELTSREANPSEAQTRRIPQAPRQGLHLATRSTVPDGSPRRLPGLFEE